MRHGKAALAKVFDQRYSGNYPAPLFDPDQLLELSAMCLRANSVITNVEAGTGAAVARGNYQAG